MEWTNICWSGYNAVAEYCKRALISYAKNIHKANNHSHSKVHFSSLGSTPHQDYITKNIQGNLAFVKSFLANSGAKLKLNSL